MREIWFGLVMILAAGALVPAQAQSPTSPPASGEAVAAGPGRAELLKLGPDDRVLGKAGAPITIIEYASLTCPHCAHFEDDVLPKLKAKWIDTGKARLVMRDYPLDQPALRAATLARCAPPDKFYGLVETMFAQQPQWVLAKDYKTALARIAELAGISRKEFDACLANKAIENQVLESRLKATQVLGVNSTPTFFINGTQLTGAPTEEAFDTFLSRVAGS
jgi:protein-disulfide isomerase